MIDDTPDVKWSNPWWGRLIFGIILPPIFIICFIVSLVTKSAFAIGYTRFKINFVPVDGLQAILMAFGYLGIGISLFAFGYARYSERLSSIYEYILLPGLLLTLITLGWCSFIFYTG